MTAPSIEADRERVFAVVANTPGMTTLEIAKALGMKARNVLTDLSYLERHGRVERWHDGAPCRWFPPW
jgi:predicted ArsR family transcriptional regulator